MQQGIAFAGAELKTIMTCVLVQACTMSTRNYVPSKGRDLCIFSFGGNAT